MLAPILNFGITNAMNEPLVNNKLPIAMGISIIVIVIIALLMTRQLLDYNYITGNILYILTIVACYGIGSFVLLSFAHNVSRELRNKSRLSNIMHWTVIIVQFGILITLVCMLFFGNSGYIYNPQPGDNFLSNRMLYSGGLGIDILTSYDFTLKLEWTFNQLGQNGLFLHRKTIF